MIKVALIACLAVALTVESYATVSFQWENTAGSATYVVGGTTNLLPKNSTLLTYISMSDATINFDTGSLFQSSYGDDVYVGAKKTSGLADGTYGTTAYTLGGVSNTPPNYIGKQAYFVLLNFAYSSFTNSTYNSDISLLPAGTIYGVSTLSASLTQFDFQSPPAQAQKFNVGTVTADIALVPEPSTFALLGIGLGLVGLRRFRRK